MPEFSINMDELAFVLHRSPSLNLDCYLDLDTGNIINVPTERNVLENLFPSGRDSHLLSTEKMIEELLPDHARLLFIPDLFEQHVFNLMIRFQESIEESDPELAEQLLSAIHKEGGFTAFRKLIQKQYRTLKAFIRFRDAFFEKEAEAWLKNNNISVVQREKNLPD